MPDRPVDNSRGVMERFRSIHWGDDPQFSVDVKLLSPEVTLSPGVEIRYISYVGRKGGQNRVWRHEFSRYRGKYPRLLHPDPEGRFSAPHPSSAVELVTLGRVIDMEDRHGRVIFTPLLFLSTTVDKKGPLILTSPLEINVALEQRKNGTPFISSRGIEK